MKIKLSFPVVVPLAATRCFGVPIWILDFDFVLMSYFVTSYFSFVRFCHIGFGIWE